MNLDQLLKAQQAAGDRYQSAINTFYEAYVTLASIDAALASPNVNDRAPDVRSFFPLQADLFDHPVYCPLKLPCDWRETISVERDRLIAEFDSRPARRVA